MAAALKAAGVVVVTCMDARIRVDRFGLRSTQVNVLRNAGGRATDDVLRSLVVAWRLLGVQEFLVVHHTDCRMMATTDEYIRQDVTAATGADASRLEFLTFTNLRQSVEEDVDRIRRSPYLAGAGPTSGYIWDLRTEKLRPVVVDPRSRAAAAATTTKPTTPGTTAGTRPPTATVPSGGIWTRGVKKGRGS